ncbi:MAG TPA: hypothetical protein VND45_05785 [Thermoanaerobaculia bacterium]|nr:hypothetical protein [Thermoanaerobaculia bacterium]
MPPEWQITPAATHIRGLRLDENGTVTQAFRPLAPGPVGVDGNRLVRDGKPLTEAFTAIDSFDYSPSRDEVVFSAKRDAGFDIGLVAGDGSKTNWAPGDPADEVMVEWAPRGYKISYVVRASMGDVVRTLHVPTSYQYAIDFGTATISELAWGAAGEKYAVAYSTLDASDRVEVLRYDGRDRTMPIRPAEKLAVDVVPFAAGAFALRPQDLRYEEKLPVVVWQVDRFDWSDARAALLRNARVAVIVARTIDDALWQTVRSTPWLDSSRTFAVTSNHVGRASARPQDRPAEARPTFVIGDPAVPAGHFRRQANVVAVAPVAVQSFAAGFIADQLKRTSRTNGSSR